MNAAGGQLVRANHLSGTCAEVRRVDARYEDIVPTAVLSETRGATDNGDGVVRRGHDAAQTVTADA